jgi:hypothetical protein
VPVLTTNNVNFSTNEVAGEYIILNTNACDMKLLAVQGVFTNTVTNLVVNATNNPSLTNITVPGTTNTAFFEQSLLSYQTQHVFLALQVNCATTNTLAVRQGMDSFRYTRTSFDSLIGRYYQPITNYYRLVENTNSTYVTNFLRRVVTFPDIWFDAVDLDDAIFARAVPNFSTNALDALSSGVGPGIINPGWIITFNKVGPLVVLSYAPFLVENGLSERTAGLTGGTNFVWGSYNGTDAEPIVYPSQSSIASLQNMFSFQIVTTDLPVGRVGAAYSAQLQAEGGQEPVVWSLAPGSAPFAAGLQLSGSGLVSGTPAAAGQFKVMVVARDSANRVTERPLTLTIQVQ